MCSLAKKLTTLFVALYLPAAWGSAQFSSWPEACAAVETVVSEGDLIYLEMPDYLFRRVAESTRSWTSHVGVVFKNHLDHWVVSESTIPFSKDTPLCDFLKTTSPFRFQIKRFEKPLSKKELIQMRTAALSLLGQWYDLSFNFDSSRMFCSKMTYLVYQSVGISIGQVQTFQQLLDENPQGKQSFWRFYFLGFIPWERRTITPANQNRDPHFKVILDSF